MPFISGLVPAFWTYTDPDPGDYQEIDVCEMIAGRHEDCWGCDFYVPLNASFYADANKQCTDNVPLGCTQTFNPCNIFIYANSVKKIIKLAGAGCTLNIVPTTDNIEMKSTEYTLVNSKTFFTTITGKYILLKIVQCQ